MKGRTYTCRITDNITVHKDEEKKKEKKRRDIRRSSTYRTAISENIANTAMGIDRGRERETNTNQATDIDTYNEW